MDIQDFSSCDRVKYGMNFVTVPLEGRRGNKVRNSVDVCGAKVDWDGDETFKRWDPWGVQNSSMLAIPNNSTSANFEEVSSVEDTFPKP